MRNWCSVISFNTSRMIVDDGMSGTETVIAREIDVLRLIISALEWNYRFPIPCVNPDVSYPLSLSLNNTDIGLNNGFRIWTEIVRIFIFRSDRSFRLLSLSDFIDSAIVSISYYSITIILHLGPTKIRSYRSCFGDDIESII